MKLSYSVEANKERSSNKRYAALLGPIPSLPYLIPSSSTPCPFGFEQHFLRRSSYRHLEILRYPVVMYLALEEDLCVCMFMGTCRYTKSMKEGEGYILGMSDNEWEG